MKKLLLLSAFVFLTSFSAEQDVYLCDTKGGKKYHFDKECRGLSNCKGEIIKVTLKEAKDKGKTICGYED
ncbi:hypothetical protein R1T16_09540 [Flavobacterium sp. DG1-102-2]|uniref:hypothetical protein n=1 Tax=Flavobacterium sp. DG1-102-2 TaxID=3081663 RepID=UPI002948E5C2|nr:hypothetical protein [Flavobacterium sp. DG1-102-2]MDV6168666.1 hypothetical protein [Flavobacterium sp. DG1-102-2]